MAQGWRPGIAHRRPPGHSEQPNRRRAEPFAGLTLLLRDHLHKMSAIAGEGAQRAEHRYHLAEVLGFIQCILDWPWNPDRAQTGIANFASAPLVLRLRRS